VKVLLDLNVILDVLLQREPHAADAAAVMALAERKVIDGCICAASVDTLFFLVKRDSSAAAARAHVRTLLSMLAVIDVTDAAVRAAVESDWPDLEDAIIYQSARVAGADLIVTRNRDDFRRGELPLLSPAELVALLRAQNA
jgi:predicted nucleic acid-binding protein